MRVSKEAGVYLVRNVFGQIVYVGQTREYEDRKYQHKWSHDLGLSEMLGLESWEFRRIGSQKERDRLEVNLIQRHNPPLNKNRGGTHGKPRA